MSSVNLGLDDQEVEVAARPSVAARVRTEEDDPRIGARLSDQDPGRLGNHLLSGHRYQRRPRAGYVTQRASASSSRYFPVVR